MTSVGGVQIPRLILGYLPFVGESYQGTARNTEYSRRFSNIENTVAILTKAVEDYGITVVGAPTPIESDLARRFLKAVEQTSQSLGIDVALITCVRVPLCIGDNRIGDYRRWLTYYTVESKCVRRALLNKYLDDPVLQAREKWKPRFLESMKKSQPYCAELGKLEIDYNMLGGVLSELRDMNVLFVNLGSEIDLLAMGKRMDLVKNLVDWICDNYGYRCLLSCHHAGTTIPILESSGVDFYGHLTPLNRLGVMMFPTQRASEDSVKASRHFVMAIKPFAGGRLHPKVALQYVYNKLHIASCMIGVGLIRGVRTRCLSGFTNPLERYMRSIPACWYEPSFLSMMIVKLTRKIWWLCLPSR